MRNKIGKYLFVAIVAVVLAIQFLPSIAIAQNRAPAADTGFEVICSKSIGIAGCIARIYMFSLGAGALIALLMVVLAGYRYMTAGGNAEQVSTAKESFESALKGLIIIFVGFILLYLINPDLVQFKNFNQTLDLPKLMPQAGDTTATTRSIAVSGNNTNYHIGDQVSISFSATPAGTYTWSLGGGIVLPAGLAFNPTARSISGTILAIAQLDSYPIVVQARDSAGQFQTSFTLNVQP